MYVSNVHQSWGTDYGNDVRKLILMGGEQRLGLHVPSWHLARNGRLPRMRCSCVVGGSANVTLNCYGTVYSHPELTAYSTSTGDFFPGIRQMLKRWDGTYAINSGNLDASTVYNGGTSSYGRYRNSYAISQGSLIGPMRASTVPASISTYLLCGNNPSIPNFNDETDGPTAPSSWQVAATPVQLERSAPQ